jgi:two-component system, chemotaxis family, sensor kinase CheA
MKINVSKSELQNLKDFLEDSKEILSGIEEKIVKLESEYNEDLIGSILKSIDALNSSPVIVKLEDLHQVTSSTIEMILSLRKGNFSSSTEVVDSLLLSVDVILRMLNDLKESLYGVDINENDENDIVINIVDIPIDNVLESLKFSPPATAEKAIEIVPEKPSVKGKAENVKINQDFMQQFVAESIEYITVIEHNLLVIESDQAKRNDVEIVNVIFRALHNMKGGSSLVISTIQEEVAEEFPLLVFRNLSHASETILQSYRDSGKPIDEDVIAKMFLVIDNLKVLMNQIPLGGQADIAAINLTNDLKKLVNPVKNSGYISGEKKQISNEEKDSRLIAFLNVAEQSISIIEDCHKSIIELDLKPDGKILEKYIRALNNLISSAAYQDYKDLSNILIQVKDVLVSIKEKKSVFDDLMWEILLESLIGIKKEIAAITAQREIEIQTKPAVIETVEKSKTQPAEGTSEKTSLRQRIAQGGDAADTLRVKYEKIDKLMNLIGELIVTKNIFTHISKKLIVEHGLSSMGREIKDAGAMISRIADDLQTTIMDVRMLPIMNVFQKFPRMVRDICKTTGKEINLVIEGEDTHLDKAIIEKINDPLIHLIRNSLDHGIESTEQRIKNGKKPTGTVKLRAETNGNIVSIEISDDGKGLDTNEIKQKAIEKNIISVEKSETMTEREIHDLLFFPGFSTAKKVTEFSGRGVGLDVVKTNINAINGTIEVGSEKGVGTTVKLLLPLTLVISKGLMVSVSDQNFILPLESIQETVKIASDRIHKFKNHFVTEIRGEVVSLIPLAQIFGLEGLDFAGYMEKLLQNEIVKIVVLNINGLKAGLIVNNFSNEQEVVIKPLDHDLARVKGISGATIMGDGTIVLILNPDEILQLMFNKLKNIN